MKKLKYWYRRFIYECPICGHIKEHRERVYKPWEPNDPPKIDRQLLAYHCNY